MSNHHIVPGSLADIGENALVATLLADLPTHPDLITGPGDDCAVVARNGQWDTLLKTDCVVEYLHFLPTTPPELIGRKALARAVSDIAAMGGTPEHALITLLADPDTPVEKVLGIYRGIGALAREYGISVAGGESSALAAKGLAINVALTGKIPTRQAILRSTARSGDLIAVTGVLGGSFPTEHHLTFTPRLKEAAALRRTGLATAMMDLSDGLGADLPRLAKASGLGFTVDEPALPCRPGYTVEHAITNGEDYELLFTIHPDDTPEMERLFREEFPSTPVTVIGFMHGGESTPLSSGWQHYEHS